VKRLSGWDAVLLYSETPTVHMHTLKLAVIELDDLGGRKFGVDEFRKVTHSRLHKLDPFRYELVDIPFKFHHPMWRENCEVDLDYHVRPYRVDTPGGRHQLDDAVGRIASTPLDRSKPLWEMYFIEGLANGRIAVLGKIPSRAGRWGGVGEPVGAWDGSAVGAGRSGFVRNGSRAGPQ
jgi:diacylglycerol O-acyltransferase / wax synthase